MFSVVIAVGALVTLTIGWFLVFGQSYEENEDLYVPCELIVKFKAGTPECRMKAINAGARCETVGGCPAFGHYVVRGRSSVQKLMSVYSKRSEVEYCEPNYRIKAQLIPNDSFFTDYQYAPQKVHATEAWDVVQGGADTTVAIIDSGVQLDHPDLETKLVPGYDFVKAGGAPNDGFGHGTHVAGIIAATTNNARGIAGIAPEAKIMPIRVLDDCGNGTLAGAVNGIVYAVDKGAQVINLSFFTAGCSHTLRLAVDYAWKKGAVLVASSGNDGTTEPSYPANYDPVIAVASTDMNDRKSSYSNYGVWVDVAAPGESILSTFIGGRYAYLSGTSMAAPHVAGLAALLAAQGRSNADIRACIEYTCDPIPGTGTYWAYGRINAERAVRS